MFRELVRTMPVGGLTDYPTALPPHELRFVLEYADPPVLEEQALRLTELFPPCAFKLQQLSGHPGMACFLVLRFPGFDRIFRQPDLFKLGYELCDALALVSVEPDLGVDFYTEPETQEVPAHEGAFLRSLCQVTNDPPDDTGWAPALVRAPAAWEMASGKGVRIGHADTGYTNHSELDGALDLTTAVDLLDATGNGVDPLQANMANPGHGTATGSVIASRRSGRIFGIAPEALLVPIRCIDDVKVFNQAPVAAAIAYAQSMGCHIISMSLGGVPSHALYTAITSAVNDNIIVLAAAGNCVTTVVWPARYDEVIAVAGCNHKERPWIGSCHGAAVDITAPAEHVWCAKAEAAPEATAIKAGQGTSYAVATVAGAAALWIEHHGRDAIVAEAGRRGITVQILFKIALQATSRKPDHWDVDQFGPGILDVLALLEMPLTDIPKVMQRESASDVARSLRRMLSNENGPLRVTGRFDWQRYGCELATIALQAAKEGAALSELNRESKSAATLPSPQLADAIDRSNEAALLKFGLDRATGITIVRPRLPDSTPLAPRRFRQALSITPGSALESMGHRFDPAAAQAYLQHGGLKEQLSHLESKLQRMDLSAHTRAQTIDAAEEALASAARGSLLDAKARFGFEALIALTGRPALRTVDGKVSLNDPRIEDWCERLYQPVMNWHLDDRVRSVGRIDLDGRHIGTGFVIAPGLILTNRHVLQEIATPIPSRNAPQSWIFDAGEASIDFADDPAAGQDQLRFVIEGVAAAGEHHIENHSLDFSRLDAAILRVEKSNRANKALPPALGIWSCKDAPARYATIVTIGYPAQLSRLPRTPEGTIDDAGLARLDELYKQYSVRYLAPGEITIGHNGQQGSQDFWTMRYDATTLGGCSGSCVLLLDPETGVAGLHFGGTWRTENFGHAIGTVRSHHTLFNQIDNIRWIPGQHVTQTL